MLSANEDHVEEYALTSHAQEAIEYVRRLSGDRSMFSQSRIRTILEAARRCANDANPDRNERVRRLDEQVRRLIRRAGPHRRRWGDRASPLMTGSLRST